MAEKPEKAEAQRKSAVPEADNLQHVEVKRVRRPARRPPPPPSLPLRLYNAVFPIIGGLILDFADLATLGPVSIYTGLLIGGLIGWLMELYQRGIIDENTSDGLRLEWGNSTAILQLIDKIANRQGLGDIVAEGGLRAAERIGANSIDYLLSNIYYLSFLVTLLLRTNL